MGRVVPRATIAVVSTRTPSQRGWATTEANVSFGEVIMPRNRAGRLRGGVPPVVTDELDIGIEGTPRIVM
jgi:hypothetical protein